MFGQAKGCNFFEKGAGSLELHLDTHVLQYGSCQINVKAKQMGEHMEGDCGGKIN